ncbi:hypothetical protein CDL12_04235 [Handroanthus impetiginosus]|uniref:Wound-responsive family protein n=1 Tax=Handroanthus impetiginosus TaxID=429701 RepID=A0A2G9GPQ1_9LAMI|nr:hypothetical protein CDL12_20250 [Handroanthus impetiginosus]PIN23054.1 hypothetical protein CDL12_04235 [Handroanthus impetiginosus]
MSAARGSWVVAASLGAVEALKDQGVCRWNYVLRSMQQHAKTRLQSYYQNHINLPSKSFSSSGAAGMVGNKVMRDVEKIRRTEKSLKKVMDLSCWGPSTARF